MTKKAIYLAGGGARGAYQAGVLKAIHSILTCKKIPFDIISGVSVGCINAAILAENAGDFEAGTQKLEKLWSEIHSQQIFNASNYELSKSVLRNVSNILVKQGHSGYLLNTEPLRNFITDNINFKTIKKNIENKLLDAMEVISNCYETHQTISFYQTESTAFEDWNYPRHASQKVDLSMEYILASGSLPLFFPPVKIKGFHYGDGSMGLAAPLRGCIRLKVDKILILGTRMVPTFTDPEKYRNDDIGIARILGSILNGVFLDNLDRDIEMVNHMNEIAHLLSMWKKRRAPWRPIQTMHLRPGRDIALIAQAQYHTMPALLKFLLNVLGAKSHSGDLLSFLLFEKAFTRELITMGYQDTIAQEKAVRAFFD